MPALRWGAINLWPHRSGPDVMKETHYLQPLLEPRSVGIIGASDRPGSLGQTVTRNMLEAGFHGRLFLINPNHETLFDLPCYKSVEDVPHRLDLAVICTPAATVPGLIAQLGERGTRAAVVVTAGLDKTTRQAMLDAARPHTLRILGPNCIGMLVPHLGLNASFAHIGAQPGERLHHGQCARLVAHAAQAEDFDGTHGRLLL